MKKLLTMALAIMLVLTSLTGLSFAEERTVLTIASMVDFTDYFATDIYKRIEDELNIDIQFTVYDKDSFAAMMSSGDLADIMMPKAMLQNVLESGLALNVDPYIDEYAPNLRKEQCAMSMELSRQLVSPDGNLYIMPPVIGMHNALPGGMSSTSRGYVVRWDWYKELGCPEIHNDDDFIAVLKQMMEAHPTAENGEKTIAYGIESDFGDMGGYRSSFKSSVNLNTWANYQYKNNIFTNEVYDGYLDVENSRYYDEMEFLNKLYREGLLEEDCFTHTGDEFKAKAREGRYCGLYYVRNELYNERRKEDPETLAGYVAIPSDGMNIYGNVYMIMGNLPTYYSFIWKDSPNKELAMQVYNYMYDIDFCRYIYSGEQGVTWDYDENGVPTMFPEALADRAAITSYWDSGEGNGGHGIRNYAFCGYNPAVLADDGYPLDLTISQEGGIASQTYIMADMAKAFGYEYWGDAMLAYEKDYRNDLGESISACMTNTSTADLRIIEACNAILESNMANIIMTDSEEEFEAAVADVLAEVEDMGEAEVFERYKAEWDTVKDLMMGLQKEAFATTGLDLYPIE